MKNLSIRLKQVVAIIMILMITTVSCIVFTGCGKTDNDNEVVQTEEEFVVEEEANGF